MVIPSTYNFREAFDTFILNSYQPIILGGFKTFFFFNSRGILSLHDTNSDEKIATSPSFKTENIIGSISGLFTAHRPNVLSLKIHFPMQAFSSSCVNLLETFTTLLFPPVNKFLVLIFSSTSSRSLKKCYAGHAGQDS